MGRGLYLRGQALACQAGQPGLRGAVGVCGQEEFVGAYFVLACCLWPLPRLWGLSVALWPWRLSFCCRGRWRRTCLRRQLFNVPALAARPHRLDRRLRARWWGNRFICRIALDLLLGWYSLVPACMHIIRRGLCRGVQTDRRLRIFLLFCQRFVYDFRRGFTFDFAYDFSFG